MRKQALGVLVSGRGSNLQSIMDNIAAGRIAAEIKIVISDTPGAYALERAAKAGIETAVIARREFPSRQAFEAALLEVLGRHTIDLVVLAGFMRILSGSFIAHFSGKVMNIHPALLPSFPGLDAQGQAVRYGAKVSGCTVHFVDEGMDTGPIIMQQAVEVRTADTADDLAARILEQEHILYPEAVRLFCEQKLIVDGRRVIIKED